MKRSLWIGSAIASLLLLTPLLLSTLRESSAAERPAGPRLAHMVYFELAEKSDEARDKLIAGCREFLSGHEGTVFFAAGPRATELAREVNDTKFDVSLLIVFRNKAAHDRYQTHPRHLKFIEECKELWKDVRVFDSFLAPPARDRGPREGARGDRDPERPERIPLPDPASGFAGMIEGKVVAKRGGQLIVEVEKVLKEWEQNKAERSSSLVGKKVLVRASRESRAPGNPLGRFIRMVKVGEVVELDVNHTRGEALNLLELTEAQRKRVAEE